MKAGFGHSDITPRVGVQLAGYGPYLNRAATEILAPLSARALVLDQGRHLAVLLSLELCGTTRLLAKRIRTAVARRIGCRPSEVFVSSTHTHSGPATGGTFGWGEPDRLYLETLPARAAEAAFHARNSLTAVEWRYAEVPCPGIAVNRETDAGNARTVDFKERMDFCWRPDHPEQTDAAVRILSAYAGGKLRGFLHHFGCHPVVCGEETSAVHGDYPGLASRNLEARHPGAVAVFLPGALGDVNPKLNHRNPRESLRAVRTISRQYARAVARGLKKTRAIQVEKISTASREKRFTRRSWSEAQILKRIVQLERIFAAGNITDAPHRGGEADWLLSSGAQLSRLEGLRSILGNYRHRRPPNPPVHLDGLRIGPVALLGCGLEVYHSLQAPVMAGSPHPHTWVVSLAGGCGYAPDKAALNRSGYTGDFVPLMTGELPYTRLHDELPRALVKLAAELS